MARPRNPERDKSKQRFLESNGNLSNKQLSEMANIPIARIRKWKHEDSWEKALAEKPRRRGGQPGNNNASGKGAPSGNLNAVTHGAFRNITFADLTPEQREVIESISLNTKENLLYELKSLIAKKLYLETEITKYNNQPTNILHVDKVVHMYVPKAQEDDCDNEEVKVTAQGEEELKTAMKTVVEASPFDRSMKLEAELNKVHGRILKLLDTIKSYDLEHKKLDLEERKYAFAKQRITGEFNIDVETGEIIDKNHEN